MAEDASDTDKPNVALAIENLFRPERDLLSAAAPYVFHYFKDVMRCLGSHAPMVAIERASKVWEHVQIGGAIHVSCCAGDEYTEAGVYFSIECECDWEIEHGLQLVIRDGDEIAKVGGFDGHLTNAHAFAEPNLRGVIYKAID